MGMGIIKNVFRLIQDTSRVLRIANYDFGHGNENGNERGPYACMLASTPDQPLSHGDAGFF